MYKHVMCRRFILLQISAIHLCTVPFHLFEGISRCVFWSSLRKQLVRGRRAFAYSAFPPSMRCDIRLYSTSVSFSTLSETTSSPLSSRHRFPSRSCVHSIPTHNESLWHAFFITVAARSFSTKSMTEKVMSLFHGKDDLGHSFKSLYEIHAKDIDGNVSVLNFCYTHDVSLESGSISAPYYRIWNMVMISFL